MVDEDSVTGSGYEELVVVALRDPHRLRRSEAEEQMVTTILRRDGYLETLRERKLASAIVREYVLAEAARAEATRARRDAWMKDRICEECGTPATLWDPVQLARPEGRQRSRTVRSDRRYCSYACRQPAHRRRLLERERRNSGPPWAANLLAEYPRTPPRDRGAPF